MAKFSAYGTDELFREIERLGSHTEEIAKKVLLAAAPTLYRNVVAECRAHRRTGTMINSIKTTRVGKQVKSGAWFIVVRPTGMATKYISTNGLIRNRKTPVRNMEIMAHMEFGTSKQPPTPVLSKAIEESADECARIMQDTFNMEVEKL